MEWQLIPVGLLVAGAAWYLGRETWRSWQATKTGCSGGCGCRTRGNPSTDDRVTWISSDQLAGQFRPQDRPG
jgi:hypothetical protein